MDLDPRIVDPELGRICLGESFELNALGCDNADDIEWSSTQSPPGGSLNILQASGNFDAVTVTPSAAGTYTIQVCCTQFNVPITVPTFDGPFLNCPHGVPDNSEFQICLTECPPGSTFTYQITGAAAFEQVNNCATITSAGAGSQISVIATCVDANGNEFVEDCTIKVYDQTLPQTASALPSQCFAVRDCDPVCNCDTFSFTVEDCSPDCSTDYFGEAPKVIDKSAFLEEECETIELVPLVGVKQAFNPSIYEIIDDCGCKDDCETLINPDMPVFGWNDICSAPGWTVAGEAAKACDCDLGESWIGGGTFSASGPPCFIDYAVIKDHNLIEATVTSSHPIFGGQVQTSICQDLAKIGGFIRPIVINFTDPAPGGSNALTTGNFDLTVTGTTANGEPISIGKVFVGQKLFLPDDALPEDFVNPFDMLGCEFEVKQSTRCRRISRQMKPRKREWSITFEASPRWIDETLSSFNRYLCAGNEGYFQPSRNNKPDDVLCFDIVDIEVRYVDCCYSEVTLTAESYVNYSEVRIAA